jgi:hypothetical protein
MIRLNGDGDTAHTGPAGTSAIPDEYLETAQRALKILTERIVGHYHADEAFKALPGGKTLTQMVNGSDIWVNYDPSNKQGDWGWTRPRANPLDVVISQFTLRMGRWSTVGTIVHEMAHLDGAPGGRSHAAEETLKHSGLQSPNGPYNPAIRG